MDYTREANKQCWMKMGRVQLTLEPRTRSIVIGMSESTTSIYRKCRDDSPNILGYYTTIVSFDIFKMTSNTFLGLHYRPTHKLH